MAMSSSAISLKSTRSLVSVVASPPAWRLALAARYNATPKTHAKKALTAITSIAPWIRPSVSPTALTVAPTTAKISGVPRASAPFCRC